MLREVFEKIDATPIIRGHIQTLRKHGTNQLSFADLFTFFALPFLFAGVGGVFHVGLTVNAVNGLLTAFSIFAGLLFNLLVMVLSFLAATQGSPQERLLVLRKELLRQLTANLSFAILCSLIVVGICVSALSTTETAYIRQAPTILLFFGTANFLLTLLMILKRMYALLQNDFELHKFSKVA